MAEPYEPARRVYRRDAHRYVLSLLYLAGGALFLIPAVVVHPAWALGCVPFVVLAYLTFRIGIFPSADGVTVRNVLRSRRLAWDQIQRFDLGDWGGFSIGGAYLADGRFVRAFALNPPFEFKPGVSRTVPRLLEDLNAELGRARAAGSTRRPQQDSGPAVRGSTRLRLDR